MIQDEIYRVRMALYHKPSIDITRLCYLVDDREWDALVAYMASLRRATSELSEFQPTRMFWYGLEVRKR